MRIKPYIVFSTLIIYGAGCSGERPATDDKLFSDDKLHFDSIRSDREKKGYNDSSRISSTTSIQFHHKRLAFVQDLFDSSDSLKGKVYVELFNDSIFKRLFILSPDQKLSYFVGDSIFTNGVDTNRFSLEPNPLFKFALRNRNYVVIVAADKEGRGISDNWTIQFDSNKNLFDNPYRDAP